MADLPTPPNGCVVGECIYCGSIDKLTREHAVPYGLNGAWTLHNASCDVCAAITHRFERDTLKSLFPAVRAVLAMQTRRPKERPKTLPLVLEARTVQRVVQVVPTEFPLYLPIVEFPPPGFVDGRPPDQDIPTPALDFRYLAGPSFADVASRYPGIDFIGARVNFAPEYFARTPLKDRLLRRSPRTRRYAVSGRAYSTRDSLFAQFGAPEYHVAIGPAAPEFVNSTAWPWK